jgi:leucyl aminopeptidase
MSLEVKFVPLTATLQSSTVLLCGPEVKLGPTGQMLDEQSSHAVTKSAAAADFTARSKSSIEILAPSKLAAKRLVLMGSGHSPSDQECLNLGGAAFAAITVRKGNTASIVAEFDGLTGHAASTAAADLATGSLLRSYDFKTYRTDRKDDDSNGNGDRNGNGHNAKTSLETLYIHTAKPDQAAEIFTARRAVAEGVAFARDLVNEPANILGPVEFAERVRELTRLGLEVEILDVEQMTELRMGALLGVAQGSAKPARLAIVQWHGAKSKRAKPLCFVGKGVTFDTGGISIKPGGGMEDMKGDMGGAACVAGLMMALAGRKAPVNAVGLIGLVENMPSGNAQRPGDIVTSMSGQTIEVINTDAEGRLVLADVLWYAQERFKPKFVIDLATLTGAIMVALGKEYAGLFSNNDKLADDLMAAGEATAEKVWRMPLAKAYDKLIDSKFADMKNIGGRHGGAITAAQFIQRFIKDTPWAHLDVAGTAMDSGRNDINTSWGSGWGVRLLDRLVTDAHEKPEK